MKGISGGAMAGIVVGAAALAGVSLVGSLSPAPERIGVVAEVEDTQVETPTEAPAGVAAEVMPSEEPAAADQVAEAEVAAAPAMDDPTSEVSAALPKAPARIAEAGLPEAPLDSVPEEPVPEAGTRMEVSSEAPGTEVAGTPQAEPASEIPDETASAEEIETAEPPASAGDGPGAPAQQEVASSDGPLPTAPVLPAAAPLTAEEALGAVAPTEPAPVEPDIELASSATVVPGEAADVTEMPEEAAPDLPGRVRVGGSALPGRDAVRVNRPGAEAPAEEPGPVAEEAVPSEEPALQRYAAAWEAPDDEKPRLALVLLDDGATDPQAVAALPWPVSVALDPLAPDAAGRLAAYRAAGVEALVLASLPSGTQPVDLAATLGDSLARLPETVAVLDLGEGGLAGRDATAQMSMSVVAREGRGVILGDDGLGAGLALAGRAGVPAAELLRDLDGDGQDGAAIRRGLDDAVRRAGQEGRAVVLGRVTAETLGALAEWSQEGRVAEVTVAPVSGVLGAQ